MIVTAAILLLPQVFGYKTFAVLSGSMEPQYHVGSLVFAKPTSAEEIQVGDPITFKLAGDSVATHRVISIDQEAQQFQTKGDANDTEDMDPVPFANLIGRAQDFSIPLFGYLTIFIKTKQGIVAGCALLIVVVLLLFLPDILGKGDKKEQKKEKSEN